VKGYVKKSKNSAINVVICIENSNDFSMMMALQEYIGHGIEQLVRFFSGES
jgi:hypothetical protein